MNAFDQVLAGVKEAEEVLREADRFAGRVARLLVGRLRHANAHELRQLKRELRDFDSTTGKWKR